MAGEWRTLTIDDIKLDKPGSIAMGPFGSRIKTDNFVPSGVPVIRGANLSSERLGEEGYVFLTEEKADELRSSNAFPGDIVITHRGTLGQVGIIPQNARFPRYVVSQSQMKLTVDRQVADPCFIFYYLRSWYGRHQLLAAASQTGVPAIAQPTTTLRNVSVPLPPIKEQQAIACILGTLDDKIELNGRMNQTLEAMARAIFKSWFVDFDPVRVKAEGRDPGLPDHIAALFPDSFEESELGEMPKGWHVSCLGDACHVIDCLHSKKPERRDTGLPLLQLNNIKNDGLIDMADTYFIDHADYARWITRMEACPGDCVITNVGRVGAVAQMPHGPKAALGRNMTGVRCKPDFPFPTFIIECLLSDAMKAEISRNVDTGTILEALNVRSIPGLRFARPSHEVLIHFEQASRPLRARMENALSESRTLAAIRDTLLPKLISGELRVPDAERIVGRCV